MRGRPEFKLDPRIKTVWRISDVIVITIIFVCVALVGVIAWLADETTHFWSGPYCLICVLLYVVCLLLDLFAITPFRYSRWRYQLFPDFLEIEKLSTQRKQLEDELEAKMEQWIENGIIWRKHVVVPFIRVQNTDTRQGPILRAFGLASVMVSTAGASFEIPGLNADEADQVRDRAAELARIAREDV
mgnify:CR=1 FL=1